MKKIIAYKGYYAEFMAKLSEQERKKILRALLLFETEDKIPHHYIKFIRDGIYEFRVNYFKKKTQKTPKSEIDKAVKLKNEYYESK